MLKKKIVLIDIDDLLRLVEGSPHQKEAFFDKISQLISASVLGLEHEVWLSFDDKIDQDERLKLAQHEDGASSQDIAEKLLERKKRRQEFLSHLSSRGFSKVRVVSNQVLKEQLKTLDTSNKVLFLRDSSTSLTLSSGLQVFPVDLQSILTRSTNDLLSEDFKVFLPDFIVNHADSSVRDRFAKLFLLCHRISYGDFPSLDELSAVYGGKEDQKMDFFEPFFENLDDLLLQKMKYQLEFASLQSYGESGQFFSSLLAAVSLAEKKKDQPPFHSSDYLVGLAQAIRGIKFKPFSEARSLLFQYYHHAFLLKDKENLERELVGYKEGLIHKNNEDLISLQKALGLKTNVAFLHLTQVLQIVRFVARRIDEADLKLSIGDFSSDIDKEEVKKCLREVLKGWILLADIQVVTQGRVTLTTGLQRRSVRRAGAESVSVDDQDRSDAGAPMRSYLLAALASDLEFSPSLTNNVFQLNLLERRKDGVLTDDLGFGASGLALPLDRKIKSLLDLFTKSKIPASIRDELEYPGSVSFSYHHDVALSSFENDEDRAVYIYMRLQRIRFRLSYSADSLLDQADIFFQSCSFLREHEDWLKKRFPEVNFSQVLSEMEAYRDLYRNSKLRDVEISSSWDLSGHLVEFLANLQKSGVSRMFLPDFNPGQKNAFESGVEAIDSLRKDADKLMSGQGSLDIFLLRVFGSYIGFSDQVQYALLGQDRVGRINDQIQRWFPSLLRVWRPTPADLSRDLSWIIENYLKKISSFDSKGVDLAERLMDPEGILKLISTIQDQRLKQDLLQLHANAVLSVLERDIKIESPYTSYRILIDLRQYFSQFPPYMSVLEQTKEKLWLPVIAELSKQDVSFVQLEDSLKELLSKFSAEERVDLFNCELLRTTLSWFSSSTKRGVGFSAKDELIRRFLVSQGLMKKEGGSRFSKESISLLLAQLSSSLSVKEASRLYECLIENHSRLVRALSLLNHTVGKRAFLENLHRAAKITLELVGPTTDQAIYSEEIRLLGVLIDRIKAAPGSQVSSEFVRSLNEMRAAREALLRQSSVGSTHQQARLAEQSRSQYASFTQVEDDLESAFESERELTSEERSTIENFFGDLSWEWVAFSASSDDFAGFLKDVPALRHFLDHPSLNQLVIQYQLNTAEKAVAANDSRTVCRVLEFVNKLPLNKYYYAHFHLKQVLFPKPGEELIDLTATRPPIMASEKEDELPSWVEGADSVQLKEMIFFAEKSQIDSSLIALLKKKRVELASQEKERNHRSEKYLKMTDEEFFSCIKKEVAEEKNKKILIEILRERINEGLFVSKRKVDLITNLVSNFKILAEDFHFDVLPILNNWVQRAVENFTKEDEEISKSISPIIDTVESLELRRLWALFETARASFFKIRGQFTQLKENPRNLSDQDLVGLLDYCRSHGWFNQPGHPGGFGYTPASFQEAVVRALESVARAPASTMTPATAYSPMTSSRLSQVTQSVASERSVRSEQPFSNSFSGAGAGAFAMLMGQASKVVETQSLEKIKIAIIKIAILTGTEESLLFQQSIDQVVSWAAGLPVSIVQEFIARVNTIKIPQDQLPLRERWVELFNSRLLAARFAEEVSRYPAGVASSASQNPTVVALNSDDDGHRRKERKLSSIEGKLNDLAGELDKPNAAKDAERLFFDYYKPISELLLKNKNRRFSKTELLCILKSKALLKAFTYKDRKSLTCQAPKALRIAFFQSLNKVLEEPSIIAALSQSELGEYLRTPRGDRGRFEGWFSGVMADTTQRFVTLLREREPSNFSNLVAKRINRTHVGNLIGGDVLERSIWPHLATQMGRIGEHSRYKDEVNFYFDLMLSGKIEIFRGLSDEDLNSALLCILQNPALLNAFISKDRKSFTLYQVPKAIRAQFFIHLEKVIKASPKTLAQAEVIGAMMDSELGRYLAAEKGKRAEYEGFFQGKMAATTQDFVKSLRKDNQREYFSSVRDFVGSPPDIALLLIALEKAKDDQARSAIADCLHGIPNDTLLEKWNYFIHAYISLSQQKSQGVLGRTWKIHFGSLLSQAFPGLDLSKGSLADKNKIKLILLTLAQTDLHSFNETLRLPHVAPFILSTADSSLLALLSKENNPEISEEVLAKFTPEISGYISKAVARQKEELLSEYAGDQDDQVFSSCWLLPEAKLIAKGFGGDVNDQFSLDVDSTEIKQTDVARRVDVKANFFDAKSYDRVDPFYPADLVALTKKMGSMDSRKNLFDLRRVAGQQFSATVFPPQLRSESGYKLGVASALFDSGEEFNKSWSGGFQFLQIPSLTRLSESDDELRVPLYNRRFSEFELDNTGQGFCQTSRNEGYFWTFSGGMQNRFANGHHQYFADHSNEIHVDEQTGEVVVMPSSLSKLSIDSLAVFSNSLWHLLSAKNLGQSESSFYFTLRSQLMDFFNQIKEKQQAIPPKNRQAAYLQSLLVWVSRCYSKNDVHAVDSRVGLELIAMDNFLVSAPPKSYIPELDKIAENLYQKMRSGVIDRFRGMINAHFQDRLTALQTLNLSDEGRAWLSQVSLNSMVDLAPPPVKKPSFKHAADLAYQLWQLYYEAKSLRSVMRLLGLLLEVTPADSNQLQVAQALGVFMQNGVSGLVDFFISKHLKLNQEQVKLNQEQAEFLFSNIHLSDSFDLNKVLDYFKSQGIEWTPAIVKRLSRLHQQSEWNKLNEQLLRFVDLSACDNSFNASLALSLQGKNLALIETKEAFFSLLLTLPLPKGVLFEIHKDWAQEFRAYIESKLSSGAIQSNNPWVETLRLREWLSGLARVNVDQPDELSLKLYYEITHRLDVAQYRSVRELQKGILAAKDNASNLHELYKDWLDRKNTASPDPELQEDLAQLTTILRQDLDAWLSKLAQKEKPEAQRNSVDRRFYNLIMVTFTVSDYASKTKLLSACATFADEQAENADFKEAYFAWCQQEQERAQVRRPASPRKPESASRGRIPTTSSFEHLHASSSLVVVGGQPPVGASSDGQPSSSLDRQP